MVQRAVLIDHPEVSFPDGAGRVAGPGEPIGERDPLRRKPCHPVAVGTATRGNVPRDAARPGARPVR